MKKTVIKFVLLFVIALPTVSYASYTLNPANYDINVNGQKIAVQPLNYNGTTYLPLRQISDAVGVDIGWNDASKSVEITTVDVEELKKACVMIYAEKGIYGNQGSGVYIEYDQILTADHVTNGKTDITTSDGATLTIEKSNSSVDIATLESSKDVKPVKIGDSDEAKPGDMVIVISSPDGKYNTVTYTKIYENAAPNEFLISSEGLSGGASGGALFNARGELIGILNSVADQWCFARPINDIRKAL